MHSYKVALSLLAVVLFQGATAHTQTPPGTAEQTSFSAEDEGVKLPVPIPRDVGSILAKDRDVREVLSSQNLRASQLPASWFAASEVHLGNPVERDLIVVGQSLLLGANITMFWIFASAPDGYKLVLAATAHDLVIEPATTNGFKDIQLQLATAVSVSTVRFHFDGRQYSTYQPPVHPAHHP